jgi:hypothetical protein
MPNTIRRIGEHEIDLARVTDTIYDERHNLIVTFDGGASTLALAPPLDEEFAVHWNEYNVNKLSPPPAF